MSIKPLLVTAAVIKKGEYILIAQRKADSRLEPNKWEFPGGKLEQYEHPEECLRREIKEELNLNIEIQDLLTVVSHVYDTLHGKTHVILLTYLATVSGGELQLIDCQDAQWITAGEFSNFSFAAADLPIINKIQEYTSKTSTPSA